MFKCAFTAVRFFFSMYQNSMPRKIIPIKFIRRYIKGENMRFSLDMLIVNMQTVHLNISYYVSKVNKC